MVTTINFTTYENPSDTAPYDPSVNRLETYLVPAESLMTAVNWLSPVNATAMDRPCLNEVGCNGHGKSNEIGLGEDVTINGRKIGIDASRNRQGCRMICAVPVACGCRGRMGL